MSFVSFLGHEYFFLLLLPIVYWCVDRERGARLGLLLLFSFLVNDLLKIALAAPRPYWSEGVELWASPEHSFGFPSGHAQNAAVLWTFLALRSQRPKFWVPLALLLVLLISLSRVTLGVHFPADTFGGALLGFALLGVGLKAEPSLVSWWHRVSPAQRTLAGLGVCALIVALYVPLALRLHAPEGAEEYAEVVATVQTWKELTLRSGAFLGLVVGLAFGVPFSASAPVPTKVLRFLVGVVGIAVFYVGLSKILPDVLPARFLRYFLTTFWVAYLAPLVFAKVGLLNQKAETPLVGAVKAA